MLVINAENLIMGRVASFCAKKALQGEEIIIINSEKAVITGSKKDLLQTFKTRNDLIVKGNPRHGPKAIRMPDQILRASIGGMVPKNKTGRNAIAKVKAFIGVPDKFKETEVVDLQNLKVDETKNYLHIGELSNLLGARW